MASDSAKVPNYVLLVGSHEHLVYKKNCLGIYVGPWHVPVIPAGITLRTSHLMFAVSTRF